MWYFFSLWWYLLFKLLFNLEYATRNVQENNDRLYRRKHISTVKITQLLMFRKIITVFKESNESHVFSVWNPVLPHFLHSLLWVYIWMNSITTYVSMHVSPPSLCMKRTFTPIKLSLKPPAKPFIYLCMCGVRYASAHAVNPRGTMRTIGITWCERDTWLNPSCLATWPTASSCSGYLIKTQKFFLVVRVLN